MLDLYQPNIELIKGRSYQILSLYRDAKGVSEHEIKAFEFLRQSFELLCDLNSTELGKEENTDHRFHVLAALAWINPQSPHRKLVPQIYRDTQTLKHFENAIGPGFARTLTYVENAILTRAQTIQNHEMLSTELLEKLTDFIKDPILRTNVHRHLN